MPESHEAEEIASIVDSEKALPVRGPKSLGVADPTAWSWSTPSHGEGSSRPKAHASSFQTMPEA